MKYLEYLVGNSTVSCLLNCDDDEKEKDGKVENFRLPTKATKMGLLLAYCMNDRF